MSDHETTAPERPRRYLQRMVVFLGFILVAAVALAPRLAELFAANPAFNAVILAALGVGIGLDLRRVIHLGREQAYLDRLRGEIEGVAPRRPAAGGEDEEEGEGPPPRLLGPMARLLRERKGRTISPVSMRALQDSIQARVAESHEASRYLIGLLVFLGLLGTFWGLAQATVAVAAVIAELKAEAGDPAALFSALQEGLRAPLSGMGTAFSTSLFGLSGSLILGFLELQSSQAHNRFLEELEEWLAGMTRLSSGALASDGEGSAGVPAYVQALLEQTADSLDRLQRTIAAGEAGRQQAERSLAQLGDRLSSLTDSMQGEGESMRRLYETQAALRTALERLAEGGAGGGLDAASREHLRSIDGALAQAVRQSAEGQEQILATLREELRLFARTLATALDEVRQTRKGG